MCVTCQKFDIFELGWEEHCTQILTQNQKNISKKDGKRRNYENAINPYFMWLLACYETWRKTHIGRPISNKIPSPRWAVTKVAVHLPFCVSIGIAGCRGRWKTLVFFNRKNSLTHFWLTFDSLFWVGALFQGVQNFDRYTLYQKHRSTWKKLWDDYRAVEVAYQG